MSARPPDLWAIHWGPGCWDICEDREEAEAIARGGTGEVVPLWMHAPPGQAGVVEVPREELEALRAAAIAVVTRWDSPGWGGSSGDLRHTGTLVANLRRALRSGEDGKGG